MGPNSRGGFIRVPFPGRRPRRRDSPSPAAPPCTTTYSPPRRPSMLLLPPLFSPLDEELELGPGPLDPHLAEGLVLLGTSPTFERAPALLAFFARVTVGPETARRLTEAAGAAQVALETAEADRLARELPLPPPGPAVQQLSLDGAMVPLV